jgi:hypothetical protein
MTESIAWWQVYITAIVLTDEQIFAPGNLGLVLILLVRIKNIVI